MKGQKRAAGHQMAVYRAIVAALQYLHDCRPVKPSGHRAATKGWPIKRDKLLGWLHSLADRVRVNGPHSICKEHRVPAVMVDLQDREMRSGIAYGVAQGEWPTVLSGPRGYYLARGPVEIHEAAEYIRSYLKANAVRLAGLEQALQKAGGTPLFPQYERTEK